MKKNVRSAISIYFMICVCFSACGTVNEVQAVKESETDVSEEYIIQLDISEEYRNTENNHEKITAPSKEEVIAMRVVVLEGMKEEIDRLTENIKVTRIFI